MARHETEGVNMPGGKITIRWFDQQVKAEVRAELRRRLPAAGEMLRDAIVEAISTPCPPHSAPGTAPHAETGKLRQSIFSDFDAASMTVTVGTPLVYGRILETGSRRMAPRPYLRPTFERLKRYLASYLTKHMGKRGGGHFKEV
jgi:HK97 gp10 family phage protein